MGLSGFLLLSPVIVPQMFTHARLSLCPSPYTHFSHLRQCVLSFHEAIFHGTLDHLPRWLKNTDLDPIDSGLNLFSSMICDLHWCPWITWNLSTFIHLCHGRKNTLM
uniref:Uncharacterized protein n=1 Tax=Oryzias sinensis TaxID=183150 RepID=A0A8C7WUE6_9TELE